MLTRTTPGNASSRTAATGSVRPSAASTRGDLSRHCATNRSVGAPLCKGLTESPYVSITYSQDDNTKTTEVEVSVDGDQRIVGPLHQVDAHREAGPALLDLQLAADAGHPVSGRTASMCDHCIGRPSFSPTIE